MLALELGRQRDRAAVLGLFLTAAHIVAVQSACNAPPRLPSAELKEEYRGITSFPVKSMVQYICRPGYLRNLNARSTLVCGVNNMWHGSREFCTREYILG